MIIENAFMKLPELLTSSFDHSDTFEATVVHFLSVAVLMELNARNIPRPFEHTHIEKPYPTKTLDGHPIHADLFVSLAGLMSVSRRMASYGMRKQNWIEAKAFLGSTRSSDAAPRTANAGKILRDLVRLCVLPEELPNTSCQNGRYFLLVVSGPTQDYLALHNRRKEKRKWLANLLAEGPSEIGVTLSEEPKSLRSAVGPGFVHSPDLQLTLRIHTRTFEPEQSTLTPLFWGYLTRIQYFKIQVPGFMVGYDDRLGDEWSQDRIRDLEAVRKSILERL